MSESRNCAASGTVRLAALVSCLFLTCGVSVAAAQEEIKFSSGKFSLHAFLYKPERNGPFPAILYNHGSERKPGSKPEIGKLLSEKGYVVFVPHRRSHGRSPNDAHIDALYGQGAKSIVALHELDLEDQLSAFRTLNNFRTSTAAELP